MCSFLCKVPNNNFYFYQQAPTRETEGQVSFLFVFSRRNPSAKYDRHVMSVYLYPYCMYGERPKIQNTKDLQARIKNWEHRICTIPYTVILVWLGYQHTLLLDHEVFPGIYHYHFLCCIVIGRIMHSREYSIAYTRWKQKPQQRQHPRRILLGSVVSRWY